MPEISIKGTNYDYLDSTVFRFVEGLIGIPRLKNAVLVENPVFRPFCWLASIDDENSRFIVVEPERIFPAFDKKTYLRGVANTDIPDEDTVVLALVNVSSKWQNTTINLRAPIILNPHTRKAAQVILTENKYKLAETLPY